MSHDHSPLQSIMDYVRELSGNDPRRVKVHADGTVYLITTKPGCMPNWRKIVDKHGVRVVR